MVRRIQLFKDYTSDRYKGTIDPNVEDPEIYAGGPVSKARFQELRRSKGCTILARMNDASVSLFINFAPAIVGLVLVPGLRDVENEVLAPAPAMPSINAKLDRMDVDAANGVGLDTDEEKEETVEDEKIEDTSDIPTYMNVWCHTCWVEVSIPHDAREQRCPECGSDFSKNYYSNRAAAKRKLRDAAGSSGGFSDPAEKKKPASHWNFRR